MNRPIDLEHRFHHYVADHLQNVGKLDEDAAGDMAGKLYAEWADAPCAALEVPPPGRRSVPGSVPWVPPVAGLMLAGAVVLDLIEKKADKGEGSL